MALTDSQKVQCKMLLRVPVTDTSIDPLLDNVSAAQEAEVTAILTQWNTVKLDADKINAEGLDSNPMRTEAKLRRLLALAIGLPAPGSCGIRIERT